MKKIQKFWPIVFLIIFGNSYAFCQLDTISMPDPQLDDRSMIAFYQPYKSFSKIDVQFTTCSSPNNSGQDWNSKIATGTLRWDSSQKLLEGACKVLFDTDKKLGGSIISELLKEEAMHINIQLNTANGDLLITDGDNLQIYKTTITNNIVHGFNNSNRIAIVTLTDH